jgi:mono/diheme cytochrome c family protein
MRALFSLVALIFAGVAAYIPAANHSSDQPNVEHGKYLAEHVAMCIQCHSPRDEAGNILMSRKFEGAPIPFQSPWPNSRWANTAPSILGLPQYTTTQAVRLLTTGVSRTGEALRSPMPPFRMSESDARDIIAYLKSLQ